MWSPFLKATPPTLTSASAVRVATWNGELEAQKLVDGCMERGIALEHLQLIGIAIKRQKRISDQINRGYVAGAEQEDQVCDQVIVRQSGLVLPGLRHQRGQVVRGFAPATFQESAEISGDGDVARVGGVEIVPRDGHRFEEARAGSAIRKEHPAVVFRNAQQVANNR